MILELKEAKERQKREKHENKLRRIQLAESNQYFGGNSNGLVIHHLSQSTLLWNEKLRLKAYIRLGIRDEIDKIYTEMRKQKEVTTTIAKSITHLNMSNASVSVLFVNSVICFFQWKRFMRCNGLPNAYDPGDLRQYMHMWCLETDKYNRNEQNWLLHTDERTILTQNRLVANTTRINLQQQQINVGDLYAKRAKEVLGVSVCACVSWRTINSIVPAIKLP